MVFTGVKNASHVICGLELAAFGLLSDILEPLHYSAARFFFKYVSFNVFIIVVHCLFTC